MHTITWSLLALGVVACGGADPAVPDGGAGDATLAPDASRPDARASDAGSASDAASSDAGADVRVEVTPFSEEVWTWDQTVPGCSYSNNGNPFWDWLAVGREPVDDGRYPVFLHFHGTGDVADTEVAVSIVESMASRGFVAASVPYDSLGGLGVLLDDSSRACEILGEKADCLFGPGEGSPITKICARAKADCDRGIVLAGHSQGSWLAVVANDRDDRVRAVWALGSGIHGHVEVGSLVADWDLGPCLPPSERALPANRLLVVDGESEYVYGTSLEADVRALSGIDCALGTLECLRDDGSGWSFFPDAANEDGRGLSQHCYMANMPEGDCTASTGLNSSWSDGDASYSREPALTWLAGFTDR